MKTKIILLMSVAALLAACTKTVAPSAESAGQVEITILATTPGSTTKAAADGDGLAALVDHWVLEVRDTNDKVFTVKEAESAAGTLEQSFSVKLLKNQKYKFLLWADTKGSYNTADLTKVSATGTVANLDNMDAFSACVRHTSTESTTVSAVLTRPFAQLNIITTDLAEMWDETAAATDSTVYNSYEPASLSVTVKVPETFNVQTQACSAATKDITFTADSCYADYQKHIAPTTLFMGYMFASAAEQDVVKVGFSFASGAETVEHSFTNIPLQRNFRTNIQGKLLSNVTEIDVTINPAWYGEYGIDQ